MALVPKFDWEKIRKGLAEQFVKIDQATLLTLQRVGEQFVNDARSSTIDNLGLSTLLEGVESQPTNEVTGLKTYRDRTGNLRSSIGYVILKNGEQVESFFEGEESEGKEAGKAVTIEVAEKFPKGYVLIVVAGMGYAAAVEANGFDVLSGSSDRAIKQLKTLFEKLQQKTDQLV